MAHKRHSPLEVFRSEHEALLEAFPTKEAQDKLEKAKNTNKARRTKEQNHLIELENQIKASTKAQHTRVKKKAVAKEQDDANAAYVALFASVRQDTLLFLHSTNPKQSALLILKNFEPCLKALLRDHPTPSPPAKRRKGGQSYDELKLHNLSQEEIASRECSEADRPLLEAARRVVSREKTAEEKALINNATKERNLLSNKRSYARDRMRTHELATNLTYFHETGQKILSIIQKALHSPDDSEKLFHAVESISALSHPDRIPFQKITTPASDEAPTQSHAQKPRLSATPSLSPKSSIQPSPAQHSSSFFLPTTTTGPTPVQSSSSSSTSTSTGVTPALGSLGLGDELFDFSQFPDSEESPLIPAAGLGVAAFGEPTMGAAPYFPLFDTVCPPPLMHDGPVYAFLDSLTHDIGKNEKLDKTEFVWGEGGDSFGFVDPKLF
ncbi:hypothetical protein BCR33DRAFT_717476 [Rhizoclosmatium globosum]|uniref:Uncharacterized protein n=1 Tax=Rhizoclosmatium globosum TaxID=329046 RepID=A0A1Y2C9Y6_9FUNG|nr:hypothetical protein BCR33DRAFT_717476 [Rhizoclosmatium globosum]|eukprot:ORY43839.1 hypothetical protein BCR33DRAFT_717476 [Rhizoclosmatium globosum]